MKKYITKQSSIKGAGKGLFTNASFKKGEVIGLAHVDDQPASEIGRNHNHNEKNPTANNIKNGNKRYLIASRNLNPGEEITTNYRLQPELEQPEDFKKKKGGSMTPQKDGYRTYSPFKNLPYIDVESDTIDSNNIVYDLKLKANNGLTKFIEKNTGLHTLPGAKVIREIPIKRKGGSVLKMPNKKNSKGYSRSLSATNKLFTQNFLFAKPKSRKNKVFDPNSKYYAEGGEPCPGGKQIYPEYKTFGCISLSQYNNLIEQTKANEIKQTLYKETLLNDQSALKASINDPELYKKRYAEYKTKYPGQSSVCPDGNCPVDDLVLEPESIENLPILKPGLIEQEDSELQGADAYNEALENLEAPSYEPVESNNRRFGKTGTLKNKYDIFIPNNPFKMDVGPGGVRYGKKYPIPKFGMKESTMKDPSTGQTVNKQFRKDRKIQRETGLDRAYYEGSYDEEGNDISGELENAEIENRRVNFKGQYGRKDKKAQEQYNLKYDEYEFRKKFPTLLDKLNITYEDYINQNVPKKQYGGLHKFVEGGKPCSDEEYWDGENCVPKEKDSSPIMQNPSWQQEPVVNSAAYVSGYRGGNPRISKYSFLNSDQGNIIGGGGLSFPKSGINLNATGVVPVSSNDRQYFKGAYEANVSKDFKNLNLGLGVNTAITGYPGENGFVKDPIKFQPKLNLRYNFQKGGALLTKKITCKKCGWEWDVADGGKDITTCHKCGGQGLVHAQNGGITKLTPEEEKQFQNFYKTLPNNLQSDDDTYDIRGYWDSEERPTEFDYTQPKDKDGFYHAYSINGNTGEYLKSPAHPTFQHAVDEDRKIGYRPITNVQGRNITIENESIADPEEQSFLRNTKGPINYIEADLDEDEIEEYRRGGYIVEEIDTYQKGGTVYTVKGSKGNYKKVNGKWQVDWNRSGKYQPLSKGDVKARTAILDKMAKPVNDGMSKVSSNSSDNTRVNYQKPLVESFNRSNNLESFYKKEKEKDLQNQKDATAYHDKTQKVKQNQSFGEFINEDVLGIPTTGKKIDQFINQQYNRPIASAENNWNDGPIQMVYPEKYVIGPGGGLAGLGMKASKAAFAFKPISYLPSVGKALTYHSVYDAATEHVPNTVKLLSDKSEWNNDKSVDLFKNLFKITSTAAGFSKYDKLKYFNRARNVGQFIDKTTDANKDALKGTKMLKNFVTTFKKYGGQQF